MRVPSSPQSLRKVMSFPSSNNKSDDEMDGLLGFGNKSPGSSSPPVATAKPPRPASGLFSQRTTSTTTTSGMHTSYSEGLLSDALPTAGPVLRGRERTRRSAVLRLVERRQAQKEKEREKDRLDSLGGGGAKARSSSSRRSGNCERTFSIRSHSEETWVRVDTAARSHSRERSEPATKTYITIGPGKPTRIRETSPAKAKVFSRPFDTDTEEDDGESVKSTSAESSPELPRATRRSGAGAPDFFRETSPKRVDIRLQQSSPLKTTGLLKDINLSATNTRKRSFTTEKTIIVNESNGSAGVPIRRSSYSEPNFLRAKTGRRFSEEPPLAEDEDSSSCSSAGSSRSSEEREYSRTGNGRLSSDSGTESSPSDKENSDELSRRRISLEQRFQARASSQCRFESPERKDSTASDNTTTASSVDSNGKAGFSSASSRLLYNLSSGYRQHRAAAANGTARVSVQVRRFSCDNSGTGSPVETKYHRTHYTFFEDKEEDNDKDSSSSSSDEEVVPPAPARKISLPPKCYEDPERSQRKARRYNKKAAARLRVAGGGGGGTHRSNGGSGKTSDSSDSDHFSSVSTKSSSLCLGCCRGDATCRMTNERETKAALLLSQDPTTMKTSSAADFDTQSISTVSGSGMDFFRKLVRRNCRDDAATGASEARFRREVLIDRLVADSLAVNGCFGEDANVEADPEDSSVSGVSRSSQAVSGSGHAFLRNFLRKKSSQASDGVGDPSWISNNNVVLLQFLRATTTTFNSVPVPFPPPADFYGPAYVDADSDLVKQLSPGSTIADLLDETFETDSELVNVEWSCCLCCDVHSEADSCRKATRKSTNTEAGRNSSRPLGECSSDNDTRASSCSLEGGMTTPATPIVRTESEAGSLVSTPSSAVTTVTLLSWAQPQYLEPTRLRPHPNPGIRRQLRKDRSRSLFEFGNGPLNVGDGESVSDAEERLGFPISIFDGRSYLKGDRRRTSEIGSTASSRRRSFPHSLDLDKCGIKPSELQLQLQQQQQQQKQQQQQQQRSAEQHQRSYVRSISDGAATSAASFRPAVPNHYDLEERSLASARIQEFLAVTRKAAADAAKAAAANCGKMNVDKVEE